VSDRQVVRSPLQGTVVSVPVTAGDAVEARTTVVVIESMKMEHPIGAGREGRVVAVHVGEGATVSAGSPLVDVEPAPDVGSTPAGSPAGRQGASPTDRQDASPAGRQDPSPAGRQGTSGGSTSDARAGGAAVSGASAQPRQRADVAEVSERHRRTQDQARPDAVHRRRAQGRRTARENVEDLCDPGSFVEYGPLVIAAQRRRRSLEELIERTPADGLVGGVATIAGAPVVVLSYDYTVLAGTQGAQNHRKKDRLFELAGELGAPVVFFTEGGGGRPGDTDASGVAGLDTMAFHLFARLSGQVPLVGIASGYCFAGNAALLGCCDVVIATEGSNIGMGGPAMIEGGGLGVVEPVDIGPTATQAANGVVDVVVADEAEAVAVARRYLSYFTPPSTPSDASGDGHADHPGEARWTAPDQTLLRTLVPENRVRTYDVGRVIEGLADHDSVLELRRRFAPGVRTALARVEGRALGVIANDPQHLGGAIDAAGADKGARFLGLCDAFDLPVLYLCDTPGIMVGPDAEETALVRHVSRLFVAGANLSVPFFTIVLRKAYGLGAQAMAGGSFKAPRFTVAWPTGELGGMNLEGAVRLGFRRELEAVEDEAERQRLLDEMIERAYEHGRAINAATHFELDDVIDPAESRRWISMAMAGAAPRRPEAKKRPYVDPW
jgi:acetyl-CoA carboxylase carboxyltransferase component